MEVNRLCFLLLAFLSISTIIRCADDPDCVLSVYVRTGSVIKGGTDSIISLTLFDFEGYGFRINNLETWGGLMGEGYNYFERGNLDIFSGRVPCLNGPACAMNLTSDGSGSGHGWYVNYVEVTTTGVHKGCAQTQFTVEQWLALDRSPHNLTAIRDYCSSDARKKPLIYRADLPVTSVSLQSGTHATGLDLITRAHITGLGSHHSSTDDEELRDGQEAAHSGGDFDDHIYIHV